MSQSGRPVGVDDYVFAAAATRTLGPSARLGLPLVPTAVAEREHAERLVGQRRRAIAARLAERLRDARWRAGRRDSADIEE